MLIQGRNRHSEMLLLRLLLIPCGIAQPPQIRLSVHSHTSFNPNTLYIYIYIELYKDGGTCVLVVHAGVSMVV